MSQESPTFQEYFKERSLKGWDTRRKNQVGKLALEDRFWFEKELADHKERLSTHVIVTRDSEDFNIHGLKDTRYQIIARSGRKRVFDELIETNCEGYASLDLKDSLHEDTKPMKFKINLGGESVPVDENFYAQVGITPVRLKNGELKIKIQNIDYITGNKAHVIVSRVNDDNTGKMELLNSHVDTFKPGQTRTLRQSFDSDRRLTVWVEGNLPINLNCK